MSHYIIDRQLQRHGRNLVKLLDPQPRGPRDVPAVPIRYIQLSAALPAGNGSTATGHGQGKLMVHKDGVPGGSTAGSLSVPLGAKDVDVYGLLTPGLKSGSVIAAFQLGPSWHYLMTLCTNASS